MTSNTLPGAEVLAAVYARAARQANKRATPHGPYVWSITIHELADIVADAEEPRRSCQTGSDGASRPERGQP